MAEHEKRYGMRHVLGKPNMPPPAYPFDGLKPVYTVALAPNHLCR